MSSDDSMIGLIAVLMTAVLLLGMIRREKSGWAGIGFEGVFVLGLYALSVVAVFF